MQALLCWLNKSFKILGIVAILLCAGTWALDLADLVHPCVYCRVQRTLIGLVGLLMMLPNPRAWWVRWPGVILCFFGAHVASEQIFMMVYGLFSGKTVLKFTLFMASCSLAILIGQALLLFTKRNDDRGNVGA